MKANDRMRIEKIANRDDFVSFLRDLKEEFLQKPGYWENDSLESYLEGLSYWVEDMDGYYQNIGQPVPEQIEWKNIAEMLMAASMYG